MTRARLEFFRARIAPNQYGPWWIELLEAAETGMRDSERLDKLEANPRGIVFAQGYLGEPSGWAYRTGDMSYSTDAPNLRAAIDALPALETSLPRDSNPPLCDSGLGDGKRGGK